MLNNSLHAVPRQQVTKVLGENVFRGVSVVKGEVVISKDLGLMSHVIDPSFHRSQISGQIINEVSLDVSIILCPVYCHNLVDDLISIS